MQQTERAIESDVPSSRPGDAGEVESRFEELLSEATRLWKRRGDVARLLEVSLELIELDPCTGPPFVYLGWCYEQSGEPGLAVEMYVRALNLELRGDRRDFAESRLRSLANRVRMERIEEEIADAIASVGNSRDATTLAKSLRQAGKLKWAVKAHERAVELALTTDDELRALTSWAATCRDLAEPFEALRLANLALRLDSTPRGNGPAFAVRIAALCDVGEASNAVLWGEAALETAPRDAYILRAMGRAYRLLLADGFKPSIADRAERCFLDALRYGGGRAVIPELRSLLDIYRRGGHVDRIPRLEGELRAAGAFA